ncbi:low molecular weight phosphatase family protein [Actinotalea sp. AC32]|nr:low molecular weight phosphatase family protein [Actinotalea sp. AC32]
MADGTFRVLAVCTGNICRSPAVERLLAHRLGAGSSGVEVASAGVGAVVGATIAPGMTPHLARLGVPTDGFAARQVAERDLASADLVLTMTRAHRTRVVELVPGAVRRTFTLRELARIVAGLDLALLPDGSPAERLAALVPLAAARRRPPATPADDDVVDPWGGDEGLYARAFAELAPAVDVIADAALGR